MIEINYVSKLAIAVMGEGESLSYNEKFLIALVGLNRHLQKDIIFNSLEKDFLGYSRKIVIDNILNRKAMEESISAVLDAVKCIKDYEKFPEIMGEKDWRKIYFFNLTGEKPKTIYKIEKCNFNIETKHTFWKIVYTL